MQKIVLAAVTVLLISGCNNTDNNAGPTGQAPEGPKAISYSVINSYPHDTSYFTEGLQIYNGELYESTGNKGKSKLIRSDLKTGKVFQSINLDDKYFGEGITIINDTIYQLTYQEKVGFMYSAKDLKKLGEFKFASDEGWGMTTDGKQIIASDGTSNLYFYEPGSFRFLRTLSIVEAGSLSYNVNELEYIDGYIYANQWQSAYILKIDPGSGKVVAKADLTDLANQAKGIYPNAEFLNGIAYDPATKKIYVTGKLWPRIYEVQFSN